MRGIIFKTVKEGFRRLHKAHKAEVRRNKQTKGATPVVPMSLKKADFKKKIRGTKFTGAAEFKAQPGLKRRIRVGIAKAKKEKKKFRTPVMYGKAYASDKKGKTMQIQPLTSGQRKQMKKEMAKSADREYKRVRLRKFGYSEGGIKKFKYGRDEKKNNIKDLPRGLQIDTTTGEGANIKKKKILVPKKKMLVGGLLTKGIKSAYKAYRKAGGRKTSDIVKESKVSRSVAKTDIKQGLAGSLKSKRTSTMVQRDYLKNKSGTFNRIQRKKKQKEVRDLTAEINALQVK